MKAWLLDSMEGLSKLHLADVSDPKPNDGEVVLKVMYAALNPADRYLAEGQYPARPPLPHILGRDGIGEVVAVGSNVGAIKVGDRMVVLRGETGVSRAGTLAHKVSVSADYLVPVPQGWSDEESAGATLVYLTAYQALMQWGELPPSVVLVSGASGGVGVASLQLGSAMGHTMIGLSRDAEKRSKLLELGASETFDPSDAKWRKQVKSYLVDRRVDLAIDNIGGKLFSEMIETLGDWGKVSCVGRLAGPVPEFNTASLFFRRIRIGGVAVSSYSNKESRAAWDEILRLLGRTGARPVVDSVFSFDDLPKAFERLSGGVMGKVLIAVS